MDFFSELFNEIKICSIRDKEVMFDIDLAEYYKVSRDCLVNTVKKNRQRFPEKTMFKLTKEEYQTWKSLIPKKDNKKYRNYYAFTAQAAAQLSFVLKSDIAIETSIKIIRTVVDYGEISIFDILSRLNDTEKDVDDFSRFTKENTE